MMYSPSRNKWNNFYEEKPSVLSSHFNESLPSQLDDLQQALLLSVEDNNQDFFSNDMQRNSQIPVGLKNSNNSCYFNAWIQSMYFIESFYRHITSFNAPEDIDKLLDRLNITEEKDRKRKKSSVHLIQAIQKLFVYMKHGNDSTLNPSEVIDCIVDHEGRSLSRGEELDVGEFIMNVQERVVEGLSLHRHIEMTNDKRFFKANLRTVEQMFFGKTKESVTFEGLDPKQLQYTERTLGLVNLDINKKDLGSALQEYMNYDVDLSNSDGRAVLGRKQIRITELPKILTFQLQRVAYDKDNEGLIKVNDPFTFDSMMSVDKYMWKNDDSSILNSHQENPTSLGIGKDLKRMFSSSLNSSIDVRTQNEDQLKTTFKLHGIVIQEGDAESGHYYAIVWNSQKEKWIKFNDSSVKEISEQEAMDLAIGKRDNSSMEKRSDGRPCAYCLFYVQEESFQSNCQNMRSRYHEPPGEGDQTPDGGTSNDNQFNQEQEKRRSLSSSLNQPSSTCLGKDHVTRRTISPDVEIKEDINSQSINLIQEDESGDHADPRRKVSESVQNRKKPIHFSRCLDGVMFYLSSCLRGILVGLCGTSRKDNQ